MPWPKLWSSSSSADNKESKDASLTEKAQDLINEIVPPYEQQDHGRGFQTSSVLQSFAEPRTLLATAVLTTAILGTYRFYRSYLRRIPEATNIHASFFRQRSVFGKVTSVGDGDNFRLYHTPGGILSGWGWLPGRRVPTDKKELKNQTIHIRIAGIDAPELAHFGKPAQPFSQDALQWLTNYVLGRRVRAHLHRPDQYSRVVATVYVRKGLLRRDVGLQMLKAGLAAVYEAKTGVEFGEGLEQKYRETEAWAKSKKKGMWSADAANYESPREYKTRHGVGKD